MSTSIPVNILGISGQVVNTIQQQDSGEIVIFCKRDKRTKVIDPVSKRTTSINLYIRRSIKDLPLLGRPCLVEIELAQVNTHDGYRIVEDNGFVDLGCRHSKRLCRLISGLCRHMSISAVSKHLGIRWETVKNIDKCYLHETLPALDPSILTGLKHIGVDEVARAKGHDYMTLVYDMQEGHLIWVGTGRTANVFSSFLKQLPKETALAIQAVAMDMGPSYQKSVRENLPHADIVFDRFHVMQNYSKAISNQRRVEFRKAYLVGKKLFKGCHYLLLKNADKLKLKHTTRLDNLLSNNSNLNTLYILKEQLQELWQLPTFNAMIDGINAWCELAYETNMHYLKKFADSLKKHSIGIANYAKHKLTSAIIEAGNIAIGMIRKRARGIRDTEYFKLKIRQSSLKDDSSMFYAQHPFLLT
ncbi:MAG: ISL3 family transposase [Proteobacteria bacterium]|nr:ISL3 family transposase [Pseudomonadota bacterium]